MAKPFYSMQEVCEKLGKSEDEIKALVRDGQLREFRDAGKVFFKAEDVDKLAGGGEPAASEDSGEITLEPALDELPSLTDEAGGGTSVLGLAPLDDESGSEEKKEDTVVPPSGIGVFDDDELEIDADPMAKTQVTAAASGDQVSLEGTGSGSGLLDLTREADDTSLGAELLDEIYPGEEAEAAATPPAPPPAVEEAEEAEAEEVAEAEAPAEAPAAPIVAAAPTPAVAADPTEGLFGGLLVGTAILLAVSGSVVAGVLQGFVPDYAQMLANRIWILIGGAALLPVVSMLIGWVIARFTGGRTPQVR